MSIDGWKYYNHAMIPTCAPHEEPNTDVLSSKEFWKQNKKAIFARWTQNFDCENDTGWWYIVYDRRFDIEELPSKTRKHIRQALKKVYVKPIDANQNRGELARVHNKTCKAYAEFSGSFVTEESFARADASMDYWGIYTVDQDILIGYMSCRRYDGYVETVTAKYDREYLNLRGSDAVHYTVLQYYMNEQWEAYKYMCCGQRNINHRTHAQDYKEETFGFRRAFCDLRICYNPRYKLLISLMYPFRRILYKLDGISAVHQVNGVLHMEEICRAGRSDKK